MIKVVIMAIYYYQFYVWHTTRTCGRWRTSEPAPKLLRTLAVHYPYRRLNMLTLRRYSDVNHFLYTSYFAMIYIKFILSLGPGSLSEFIVRRIKD